MEGKVIPQCITANAIGDSSNFMAMGGVTMTRQEQRKRQREAEKDALEQTEKNDENLLNPHIPQFISRAPWYMTSEKVSLQHQQKSTPSITAEQRSRGLSITTSTKYRKGACTNCGAMTHKAKDCIERPRKIGAKYTNMEIRPDEVLSEGATTWEAKRDRWNGFVEDDDNSAAEANLLRYKIIEQARKEVAANRETTATDVDDLEAQNESLAVNGGRNANGPAPRFSSRDLRIREDKAKYLLDLSPDAPHYDPKTRSMREDNTFYKNNADPNRAVNSDVFGTLPKDAEALIDFSANPTLGVRKAIELSKKEEEERKAEKAKLLEKYGKSSLTLIKPLKLPDEYISSDAQYKDVARSSHSSVWGSFFDKENGWGYACCHQFSVDAVCNA